MLREEIKEAFKEVYDLERLVGRIGFGSAGGRDLAQLRQSLSKVPIIKQLLMDQKIWYYKNLGDALEDCEVIWRKLQEAISENPPIAVKDGGVINNGYHERLDQLRDASVNGKKWIAAIGTKRKRNYRCQKPKNRI